MSYGVHYHKESPNPASKKCLVTDLFEDGVVVLNDRVEPPFQPFLFLGRTVVLEMVAQIYGMKPKQVSDLLDGAPMLQQEYAEMRRDRDKAIEQRDKFVEKFTKIMDAFAADPDSVSVNDRA